MNRPHIQKIIIVGGGTAGWMTASALACYLKKQPVEVVLIESDDIGTVGVGEATVPVIQSFNALLGIDEWEFVKQTSGSFKLGIEFRNWGSPGSRFFHGFGDFGESIDGIAPHHHWLKLRTQGDSAELMDYSFPTQAALRNKFAPPPKQANIPAAAYKYAYHFDASLYAKYLRQYSENRGVVRKEGEIVRVELDSADGSIRSLEMASGESVSGDFFLDCSGFRGLLINEALQSKYIDWSHWLPCDRAIVAPCKLTGELTPYTTSIAHGAGWRWRIPLQHRVGNGYVYSSRFIDKEAAEETLLNNLEAEALAEPRLLKFVAGHRQKFWDKNCVAIGLAGGFLEPLESSSIQLIQTGIFRFLEFFPDAHIDEIAVAEYNRITSNEYARIRDFLIAHYCTTGRDDTELWRYCRTMALPDELQHKIELFKHTGRVPMLTEESYMEASWVAILIGQNIIPERYARQVDFRDLEDLRRGMMKRRDTIAKLVGTMPSHEEFIARVCPSDIR